MRHVPPQFFAPRALRVLSAPALVALASLLAGCSSGGDSPPAPTGSGGGGTVVKLAQSNNYTFTSSLTPPPGTPVAAGEDLQVCWTDVTKDIQGHPVNAAKDINDVSLIRVISNSETEVADWLNKGELGSSQVDTDFEYRTDGTATCAKLSDFVTVGGTTKLDPTKDFKPESGITYLLVFAHGTKIGFGALTVMFVKPDANSNVSSVNAQADSSTMLDFHADLHSGTPLTVPKDEAPRLDWTAVTKNGQGQDIAINAVDSVLIGFYEGKMVSDLETGFLNLEQDTPAMGGPSQSWEVPVGSGSIVSLSKATGRAGEGPFTGFSATGTGTWLVGMFCSSCQNPAPVIVSILDPQ